MRSRMGAWKIVVLGLAGVSLVTLVAACGGGVSQEDYDALEGQLTAEQQRTAAQRQQIQTLQQQQAEGAKITTLIGAQPQPTSTPRPTPTPLPPGVTSPPPAEPEAEVVNEVLPFALYVETLATGSVSKYGYASFPSCVPNSIFKRGTKLVWRFEVIDTSTGKRVTSLDDDVTIKIVLPHGEELTPRYSKRAGTGPWTWASAWDIPEDYPLGAFDYSIRVEKGDITYTWKMPAVVNVERGTDSRVQIVL